MAPLKNTPGAAIYTRGNSIDSHAQLAQEAECYAYADRHGMSVDPEYVYREEPNTGDHWSARPAYASLLLDAMRGSFSVLIVSNLRVLESDPDTTEQISQTLAANGVTLHVVH